MTTSATIKDFCLSLQDALAAGRFIKASLGHYKGADETLQKILIKRVTLKDGDKLSFIYRHKTKDITKNYGFDDGIALVQENLTTGFLAAALFTPDFDLSLEKGRLKKTKPSQTELPDSSHDRSKNRLIAAEGTPYLHALNITDASGKVHKNAQDKYKQINRYIEILEPLLRELPKDNPVRVADMGSGKGYLTFALYDYLTARGHDAQVTGVEYREDMVELCNNIAAHSNFDGLSFVQGTIEDYDAVGINVLIALHACDTATDDAIAKGILAHADLIVVAPCCHKQIRREMETGKTPDDLSFLLRHGTFMERQAEMVTDAMRALLLESQGYTVKAFEFISDAHTPKNVMIVAEKAKKTDAQNAVSLQKFKQAKSFFGIGQHHLEKILGL